MIGDKLSQIRQQMKYSQEKFAEKIGVSRQTVQRWESGNASPDLYSMINIAKKFNVSMDWLNGLSDHRSSNEMRYQSGPIPSYQSLSYWESYAPDVQTDFRQALDEGKDVDGLREIVEALSKYPEDADKEKLADTVWQIMYRAPQRQDHPYREPDDLAAIRLLRRERFSLDGLSLPNKDLLRDKLTAAWRGRVCGCLLGQPVEGIKTGELRLLLRATDNYPMRRYITSADIKNPVSEKIGFPLSERTYSDMLKNGFPGDDDTNYTFMASYLVEKFGRNFTSNDVCRVWKSTQVMNCYCTAEKVAYRNMIAGYAAPECAVYKNPYREWIGAQIRGDYFGYINPGDPETAAEMAWRDARVSHVKNGIYGEMFVAAMNAAAAVVGSAEETILCGMSQIPETSRLYERLQGVLDSYHGGMTWDAFFNGFMQRYDEYLPHDAVHVLSNAELTAAALLWGGGDYTKTVGLAVQAGFDTDCNGATAGSVVGMLGGTSVIGAEWTDPVGDIVNTTVDGLHAVTVDDFVDTILRHAGI